MTDEYNNPQYKKPINDSESQDETEEKPFKGNSSAQIIQNNNITPQNYNPPDIINKNSNEEIPEQIQQTSNNNNNEQNNDNCENKKLIKATSIIYIIIFITDIGLQIGFQYFSLLIFFDGVIILILAAIYLYLIYKNKSLKSYWLGGITIFSWIAEYPLRALGATYLPSKTMALIQGSLLLIRTVLNFACIPYTCKC